MQWTLAQDGNAAVRSVNALVGETNDGGLNDIRTLSVRPVHVVEAIRGARGGAVAEGSVGAGTGTRAFGWKGGIGTSSRRLPSRFGGYTVGVLVQSNYGGVLTMGGAPIGRELGRYDVRAVGGAGGRRRLLHDRRRHRCAARRPRPDAARGSRRLWAGPHRLVVQQRQRRFRHRFLDGMPRCAWRFGDTAPRTRTMLPTDGVSPLFQAALEATEEAVYNSLLKATTVTSRVGTAEAIPVDRVREILKKYGVSTGK